MQIVIPTHGRIERQTTLNSLPPSLRKSTILVASTPGDAEILKRKYRVKTLSAPVRSIAEKRQWIMENIKAPRVFMMDDDMAFYRRCDAKHRQFDGRWKPKNTTTHKGLSLDYVSEQNVEDMFLKLAKSLEKGHGQVGISSRFGNDLEPTEWKYGSNRLMHAFGLDRKLFMKLKLRFDQVAFREDFHVTLEHLKRGYTSAQCYEFCVAPGAYGAPGGCSDERTVAASDEAAETLAALHPGLVRVVSKEYKGTPRKEVVVSWAKALKQGLAGA